MKNENLDAFRQGISASILKMMELDPDIFQEELEIDIALEGKELNFELIDELEKLAPFGSCNEKPNVALSQILIKNLQYMGNDRKHARFSACCKDGSVIQSVLFNKAIELKEKLTGQKVVTLLGSPDISEWNGTKRIQFLVNDIW